MKFIEIELFVPYNYALPLYKILSTNISCSSIPPALISHCFWIDQMSLSRYRGSATICHNSRVLTDWKEQLKIGALK